MARAEPDPRTGIIAFCADMARIIRGNRALPEVLTADGMVNPDLLELRAQLAPRVSTLAERGHATGILRDDVTALDLMLLVHLLGRLRGPAESQAWRRCLTVALDGLWARPDQTPLPGHSPSFEEFPPP